MNACIQTLFFCKPFRNCVLLYSYPHSTTKIVVSEQGLNLSQFQDSSTSVRVEEQKQVPRKQELDAPLESNLSGSFQVESKVKKEVDPWAGTLIDSILSKFAYDDALNDTLLGSLQNLFSAITTQKKQIGVVGPKQFMTKLKEENGFPIN